MKYHNSYKYFFASGSQKKENAFFAVHNSYIHVYSDIGNVVLLGLRSCEPRRINHNGDASFGCIVVTSSDAMGFQPLSNRPRRRP